jgi:hypothetical protein
MSLSFRCSPRMRIILRTEYSIFLIAERIITRREMLVKNTIALVLFTVLWYTGSNRRGDELG